ncbi:C-type natriuretic peptide 2-like [Microcaecilia unicolor]|uniref:C-type natriuretic peptide 2-like n=1 Tax=Microcaecilia unicolor TaxID=1415580 RepID=A0A6P7WVI7_9AMPH|nr:C-type natriuretic peptide 2-like [Microcaecilia unicolor]
MQTMHVLACGLLLAALCIISLAAKPLSQQESLRSILDKELAEYLPSRESGDKVGSLKFQSRLLRDLHNDSRSQRTWARVLNNYPNIKKRNFTNNNKKATTSKGCFGLKLDRIGALSDLGC